VLSRSDGSELVVDISSTRLVRRGVEEGWREPECRRHWGGLLCSRLIHLCTSASFLERHGRVSGFCIMRAGLRKLLHRHSLLGLA
jgi:hypothetical protein